MNRRVLLGSFLVVVWCLATLWGVWSQRRPSRQGCRAQQQLLAVQLVRRKQMPSPALVATPRNAASNPSSPALLATPELLRLRSDVTRLTERRRELAGVGPKTNNCARGLASRGTNGPDGLQLPPGYGLTSEARRRLQHAGGHAANPALGRFRTAT